MNRLSDSWQEKARELKIQVYALHLPTATHALPLWKWTRRRSDFTEGRQGRWTTNLS